MVKSGEVDYEWSVEEFLCWWDSGVVWGESCWLVCILFMDGEPRFVAGCVTAYSG